MKKIKLFLQLRKQFLFSLPLFFLINILFISNNTVAQTATVATNKSDYSPGQYVIVTGSHWLPGETVKLTFTETPLLHPEQDFFANADGAGNIYNNEYLIAEHDLGQFFTLGATGLTSGKIATTTFTDSKGAYSLHWYAADPGVNSGKFLPTYNKLQPFQLTCPTPSGLGGRASNPLPNAQLYNSLLERDGVTSLQPKDLALCQVVPFLLEINVNGSTAPENGVINFNPEFLTKTTSGDDFGFDPAYGIYCAFVDYGEPGTVDPGNNARVDLYSSKIVGAGTSNETIRGSIQVSGLNDGDNIIVEIWVVLKCSIPPNINATGNIQTSMADATTGPAGPDGGLGTGDNISLGNQVVPLSQLGTFFTADADVSVTKSASPICIGNDLTYTIVVTNNSTTTVANTIVANDVFGAGQTFVSASGAPIDPQSGQNVTFNVGALTQGQAKTLTVVTHPTAAGTVTNSVSTTAITSDPNTANNTSILVNPLTGGNVAVNPLPTCSITPTPANSNHWCATSGMSSYLWSGPGSFSATTECVDVVTPGTYSVTITNANGCVSTCTKDLASCLDAATATPTNPTCGQTTGSVQVSPFDNTVTYELKQIGVLKYTASNTGLISSVAPGTYDLVATKTGICYASGSVTVGNAPPNLTTPAGTPTDPTCGQTTGSVQVSPFDNTITYQLKQGVTLKYTADGTGLFSNVVPGTYDLIASKIGSCSATGSVTISAPPPCVPLYTYTQGYYSSTGSSCTPSGGIKVGALALIKYSLDNFDGVVDGKGTLFLGKKKINGGTGSFTLNYNSADPTKDDLTKFVSVMPGGGTAATLTADYTIPLPTGILKNGKINNVLLSQAITLALNVHIQGENLGGFKLRNEYLTTLAPSGTACPRTAPAACSNSTLSSVKLTTNAGLKNWIALGKNVNDLLQLASDALGGGNIATLTGFTGIGLTDINNVIDVINKSFDGGRFFLGYYAAPQTCSTLPNATPKLYTVLREAFVRQTEQVKFTEVTEVNAVTSLTVTAYPNPFTDKVKFSIVSPVSGKASLEVYNMMGQKIRSIYQGYLFAGKGQVIEYRISSAYQGNLIYTLRVGDKQVNGKLVQMK